MGYGRKVNVFKIRRQRIRDFSKDSVAQHRFRGISMVYLGTAVLPYSRYSEMGVAHWLREYFGVFSPTDYCILSWRGNPRSPHKLSYYRLIRMFVYENQDGVLQWLTLDKRTISRSGAWRENLLT